MLMGYFKMKLSPKMENYQTYYVCSARQLLNIKKMLRGCKTNNVISFKTQHSNFKWKKN